MRTKVDRGREWISLILFSVVSVREKMAFKGQAGTKLKWLWG